MLEGIDLSHWNGDVDFKQVETVKHFAYLKATEKLNEDPMFYTNAGKATKARLPWAGYIFYRPDFEPISQANHFVAVQGDAPLTPLFDLESQFSNGQDRWAPISLDKRIAQALSCAARISDCLKARPIIYCTYAFWQEVMGNTDAFKDYPLELAHYSPTPIKVPSAWAKYDLLQTTESGACPGVQGHVDLDEFQGSADDLIRLGRN